MSLASALRRMAWPAVRLARETLASPYPPQRAILRWAAFASARPFTDTLSATVDGIRYFVSTCDDSVGRVVFMGRLPDGNLLDEYLVLIGNELGRPTVKGVTCIGVAPILALRRCRSSSDMVRSCALLLNPPRPTSPCSEQTSPPTESAVTWCACSPWQHRTVREP